MAWPQVISLAFAFLQAISFVFTSIVAWKIYRKQKMDSDDQLKRDVRLRLTQAYYNLDNEVLRSRDNMEMARELLFAKYSSHQVERIMFLYTILDVLYLEWKFLKEFPHPGDESQFSKNLNALIGRITKNIMNKKAGDDHFLIDDFDELFQDFSDVFRETVRQCMIKNIKN